MTELQILDYPDLFSVIGITYGGNGMETFALPDMRGRFPMGAGQGPGLTDRALGSRFGHERHTLTTNELPPHSHRIRAPSFRVGVSRSRRLRSTL